MHNRRTIHGLRCYDEGLYLEQYNTECCWSICSATQGCRKPPALFSVAKAEPSTRSITCRSICRVSQAPRERAARITVFLSRSGAIYPEV